MKTELSLGYTIEVLMLLSEEVEVAATYQTSTIVICPFIFGTKFCTLFGLYVLPSRATACPDASVSDAAIPKADRSIALRLVDFINMVWPPGFEPGGP